MTQNKKQLEELVRLGYKRMGAVEFDGKEIEVYMLAYTKIGYCRERDKVLFKYCMVDEVFKNE